MGVIFQFYLNLFSSILSIILVLLFTSFILIIPKLSKEKKINRIFNLLIPILFFFIGAYSVTTKDSSRQINYFQNNLENIYQIRINEPIEIKDKSVKLKVNIISRNDTTTIGKSLVYLEKTKEAEQLKYGDILLIQTKFNPISSNGNPLEFDYGRYLKMFDIHHQSYVNSGKWKLINSFTNPLFNFTYSISEYLSVLLDKSDLNSENKTIAKALLLGQKEDLDKDTLRTFSSAGAMHVLAVSGLHVGIIMYILMFILKPIKKIKFGKRIFVISILTGVWFYAFITGLSPSVLRSSLMFSFIIIGQEIERETSVYQSILVSAFLLILIDPLVIFKVGFQLSYLAVLGIVYLQPKIYNLFYLKIKLLDYLWQITSVSIAAQIATFPLGLFYFHQFPNFFFISNLAVIPLAGLILGIGIGYFTLHFLPYISDLLIRVLDIALSIMNFTVKWVESLPYSISWGISITWYETIMIYISILLATLSFSLNKTKLLIYATISCMLLLGLLNLKQYNINSTNEIVIYNIKDEIGIDIYYGNKNIFLASNTLMNDEELLLFHVQHYWFYKSGDEGAHTYINTSQLPSSIFKVNSTSFSILDKEIESMIYKTNYVIIGDNNYISKKTLEAFEKNQCILIIHSKCKYKLRKFIKSNYQNKLIYDVKQEGAFIFSF